MAQSDLQWSKICPGTAYKKCLQQKLYERFGRGLSLSPEMLRFALLAHVGDQEAETSAMPRNEVGSHQGCEGRSGR